MDKTGAHRVQSLLDQVVDLRVVLVLKGSHGKCQWKALYGDVELDYYVS